METQNVYEIECYMAAACIIRTLLFSRTLPHRPAVYLMSGPALSLLIAMILRELSPTGWVAKMDAVRSKW